jgi:beta-lactamase class A
MRTGFVSTLLIAFATSSLYAQPSLDRLKEAVEGIVESADGEMGVAIKHLESGQTVEVNGSKRFPMASTFKLAVLVELFHQIDEGEHRLQEMVYLEPGDLHLGSGQLHEYRVPGVGLSLENLVLLMMRISDNSAADKLLEMVGMDKINPRLRSLGIEDLSVDRTCQRLILDWLGMAPEKTAGMTYQEIEDFLNAYQPAPGELEKAADAFDDDPRDTASPLAMNLLLEAIFTGKAASEASCSKMIDIMLECDTGRNRIRGFLPASVQVAHKTGTLGGTVDDVGILFLPGGRGHVAVSVLSRKMKDREEAERAIAQVARYAYDYFLFTVAENSGGL